MKKAKVFVISIVVLLFAVAAWSQCPWPGEYSTTDGTLLGGRSSEAWCSGVGPGQIGNTENAMSWDPVSGLLGTQWRAWGMSIAHEPLLIYNGVTNGNGIMVYQTEYEGGQFWLAGGYFGPGSDPFDGQIYDFQVTATQTWSGGEIVGLTSNISFEGTFNGCDNCVLEYVITNAMLVWHSGMGIPMPPDYPDFLCGAVAGELFDVCCIDLFIRCGVGVEETTWGAIKSLYK